MTHKFILTRWDLLCGQMHGLARNKISLGFFVLLGTFIATSVVREPGLAAKPLAFRVFCVGLLIVLFVLACLAATILLTGLMMLVRKYKGVLGEHTLEITTAGLIERTEFNETVHRWQGFHKVLRTRNYLYLWVTDSMMHIVPVRSFPSEESARHFQSEIETRRMAFHQTP